jgi:Fe-S cluster assembly scaffold protein SufB
MPGAEKGGDGAVMETVIDRELLEKIADLTGKPVGAFNIRKDSGCDGRQSTEHIKITSKEDKPGIDIRVLDGTKGETCHIPVIITQTGLSELVYNDFYIGEDCDVDIVAGCGIHNCGEQESRHDGVHTFYVGKNSRVRYTEKHYGEGPGTGSRVMNPQTVVYLEEGASIQMETVQIRGIDSTRRDTKIVCGRGAEAVVTERLLTHGDQTAESDMEIILEGEGSRGRVISRSVAQDRSSQVFYPRMVGNAACFGHVQCDSIIMGEAKIKSIPAITANCTEAQLIHEAAIGKIAGDQLLKLETLGLTEEEAEDCILRGFLA